MIDKQTVERIFDAAQIVEVVSDFVSLRKRGVNYTGLCPFHNERTPSFSVSPSKGIYKCFSCGKGGNAVQFMMEHEQMSYVEALRYLAKKYSVEIVEKEVSEEERRQQSEREGMFVLNEYARDFFIGQLYTHPEGIKLGQSYFYERGFREDIIRKFQLGFSPEGRGVLAREAIEKGYSREILLKTGLTLENDRKELNDRFRGRVMFPVHTLAGKVVAFGGRVLKQGEKTAKYVNSPESEIYHKSNELYGIFFAKSSIVKQDHCFLVEGYTDVISIHQAGIENVVSSSGTSLTPGQIKKIQRFTNNLTVLYDGDNAGIKASLRGIDLLLKEGMNIKVVLLPDGDDPDSFAKKHSSSEFLQFIADSEVDFIRFKTDLLLKDAGRDPIKRAALITDIVKSIAIIPEPIVRSVYVKECSGLLMVDEQLLIEEVNKLKRIDLEKELARETQALPNRFETTSSSPALKPIDSSFSDLPPIPIDEFAEMDGGVIPEDIPIVPLLDDPVSDVKPQQETNLSRSFNGNWDKFERALIRYIVRYGDKEMLSVEELQMGGQSITVARFIIEQLNEEGILFENELYRQILAEMAEHLDDSLFVSERYFTSHFDQKISLMAVDLVSDRYQLSNIHFKGSQRVDREEDRLKDFVVRAMTELFDAMMDREIKRLHQQLKYPEGLDVSVIFEQLQKFSQHKRDLAKHMGDRVIK